MYDGNEFLECEDNMKILRFTASWCAPCKSLAASLEWLQGEYPLPPVDVIDIDDNPELPQKYGVRGVPTLVMLNDNNVEVKRMVGTTDRNKLLKWISGDI